MYRLRQHRSFDAFEIINPLDIVVRWPEDITYMGLGRDDEGAYLTYEEFVIRAGYMAVTEHNIIDGKEELVDVLPKHEFDQRYESVPLRDIIKM